VAEKFLELEKNHIQFIKSQHIYFVGTAGSEGFVNVSPKGMDSLRIINEKKIIWLNLTGSGNETAAHVLENKRMTVMFCSFDAQPLILRVYGKASAIHMWDTKWNDLIKLFPENVGARQLFELEVALVQTSCGYAVPFYQYGGERLTLRKWADNHGRKGIEKYWEETNTRSLNEKKTGIPKNS